MVNLYIYIEYIAKKKTPDMARITSLKGKAMEILWVKPKLLEGKK